jgi:hypothetical protein
MHGYKRSNFRKGILKLKIQLLVLMKHFVKQLILITQSILKLGNSQRKIVEGYIITYIGVGDVSRRLAHDTKAGEVALIALDLLILF